MTTHRPHVHRVMCSSSVRRAGLLLALVTILASSASPAAAHRFPDNCTSNNAELVLARDTPIVRRRRADVPDLRVQQRDRTVPRQQRRRHAAPAAVAGAPAGHPDHARQRRGAAAADARVRDRRRPVHGRTSMPECRTRSPRPQPPAPCTTRRWTHKRRSRRRSGRRSRGRPPLAFTANPATGVVPLNVRFDYLLTNTSRTDVPMSNVQVNSAGCAGGPTCQRRHRRRRPARHGRGVAVQLLAPVHDGDDLGATALGSATRPVDTRTVASPRTRRPSPRSLRRCRRSTLTRSVSPTGGIAPLSGRPHLHGAQHQRRGCPPDRRRHDRRPDVHRP